MKDTSAEAFVSDSLSEGELKAEIAKLAALPLGLYESKRTAEAKRLGMRVKILDKLVTSMRQRKQQSTEETIAPDCEALAQSAAEIIASDSILDLFARDFGKVVAGELMNAKVLYLVGTSRLFIRQ